MANAIRANAEVDQLIAAGADWIKSNDPAKVMQWMATVKGGTPDGIREMSDAGINAVRRMAIIGVQMAVNRLQQENEDA